MDYTTEIINVQFNSHSSGGSGGDGSDKWNSKAFPGT